jgi:hypothetical protein
MANADWSWVAIAFIAAQLTNVGEYISLTGTVTRPLPFGPTIMFRYAIAFVGLAVPGDVGSIAMNARYMQKLGIPSARAVAQGPRSSSRGAWTSYCSPCPLVSSARPLTSMSSARVSFSGFSRGHPSLPHSAQS